MLPKRLIGRFTNHARPQLIAAITMVLSPIAAADDYICRYNENNNQNNNEERIISVIYDHKGWQIPCSVRYEKPQEGSITYPWRAQATPGYCEDRARFLAEKLAGFGWDCQIRPKAE